MTPVWFSALLPLVFTQGLTEFGTSHLKNSPVCAQWSCLNNYLGLPDALPRRAQYERVLRGLLPEPWQEAVGSVLDACYGNRPRRYTNTCPGQALTHCVVDQLIENCPKENWVTKDACAPVSSLAGVRYMFSQSRYNDLEINLPSERRPAWFLKNYFNSKCCDLPPLFNETILSQCGFSSLIYYYHQHVRSHTPTTTIKLETKQSEKGNVFQVIPFDDVSIVTPHVEGEYDPLDCCDMHEFISPIWRSECGFQLSWNPESRLGIKNTTGLISTTTTEAPKTLKNKDVKMVPNSCEQNNCVFRRLGVVSESGFVDTDAFSKLLNNLTDSYPDWTKARARVRTKCLSRPIRDYEYDCDINKVLACTFDILSENCPNSITPDVCRHSGRTHNEVICQISSSKYRPRNRRRFCAIPNLVKYDVLDQCNLNSLIHLEYVPETIFKPRSTSSYLSPMCKDSTPSTMCLMDRMGVLNKYNFMDYFKMKDRIREFSHGEWHPYNCAFTAVFQSVPLYKEYCSSPKKLLNIIDTMLMTCPLSKRRHTAQCNKLFSDLSSTVPKTTPESEQLTTLFGRTLINNQQLNIEPVEHKRTLSVYTNPIYNFGMFDSANAPPVKTIDLKPKIEKPPLILLPVYQRMPFKLYNREHIMRSVPVIQNGSNVI